MTTIKRENLDDAILAALRSSTMQPIGDGDVPGVDEDPITIPELPYAILTPLFVDGGHGSMENEDDLSIYHYQITCVGGDRRQASWMSRRCQEVMTNVVGSKYTTRIVGSGFQVAWRSMTQLGTVTRNGQLWNTADTYQVAVTP